MKYNNIITGCTIVHDELLGYMTGEFYINLIPFLMSLYYSRSNDQGLVQSGLLGAVRAGGGSDQGGSVHGERSVRAAVQR